ncbi:DUF1289 domain-containing protein [Atopomonas sediminilitoris]|uniref:DUF1289 domain-containing protein n=1 Tax=Atopomonas sediminilitoris TaxID=2919919 RepID=UPI001F4E65DC|nr:DUF1289 domain-containing protein [Atopomonas sediminilitoris]MCJ8168050.1 DUF1289 domain-containing protein [Atopomonas sediminilitoris]
MSVERVKTPCVGLCSTVYGDLVCRGCKRFHHEVVGWNGYDDVARLAVWRRLETLLVQVVSARLQVFDLPLLKQQLHIRSMLPKDSDNPYYLAYRLIQRGAGQITQLDQYGVVVTAAFREYSLPALRDAIEHEYFVLSEAHYQRYIQPGLF